MRASPLALIAAALLVSGVNAAELAGIVQKPSVDVYAQPAFGTPRIATLKRDTAVRISAQQGLWYELQLPAGATGMCGTSEVRVSPAAPRMAMPVCTCDGSKAGKVASPKPPAYVVSMKVI
jgi:hypothetical protein